MNILITGASGFIGKALCHELINRGHHIKALSRDITSCLHHFNLAKVQLNKETDIGEALQDIDVVVHLAGRAHTLKETSADPATTFKKVNTDFTLKLAQEAANTGVKRFIFISSIGVNGNMSVLPFNESSSTIPFETYAKSKLNAETGLKELSNTHSINIVIIRPPLVYGRNAKGNFEKLVKTCTRLIPLPFGAIHNKRSMIYIENLVDFIIACTTHPKATNETFLISDDDDVSTTELIRSIRQASGMPTWLIPIPQQWIVFSLKLIGKQSLATRLCSNLQIDISKAKQLLGWKPPYTFQQGIQKTIQNN